jgi:hypothetical protein
MEGPKSFAEKPQREAAGESVESLAESVDQAHELMAELKTFDGVEVNGGDAMELNRRAEELAAELTTVLEQIPAKDCIENGLPYHPTDTKREVPATPFPTQPEYPLDYEPVASGDRPATDAEKAA